MTEYDAEPGNAITYTREEWEIELKARLDDGRLTQEQYQERLEHSQEIQKKYELEVKLDGNGREGMTIRPHLSSMLWAPNDRWELFPLLSIHFDTGIYRNSSTRYIELGFSLNWLKCELVCSALIDWRAMGEV